MAGLMRRTVLVATLALALSAATALFAAPVRAQAALPFVAYGVGVAGGAQVEAVVGGAVVGRARADGAGRWALVIEPGVARNGDVLAFIVDGTASSVTAVFQGGRFTPPPGLMLTAGEAAPRATPSATPRPIATPRPAARPTPAPKPRCTKDGRPVACTPVRVVPPAAR